MVTMILAFSLINTELPLRPGENNNILPTRTKLAYNGFAPPIEPFSV